MFKALRLLITLIADICLLRKGPQDMPFSKGLFIASLLFSMVLTMGLLSLQLELQVAMLIAVSIAATIVIFTYIALSVMRKQARVIQTLTSLFATNVLVHLVRMAIILLLLFIASLSADLILSIMQLLVFAISVWELVIRAHIYRHALQITMLVGVILSIGLEFCSFILLKLVLQIMQVSLTVGGVS